MFFPFHYSVRVQVQFVYLLFKYVAAVFALDRVLFEIVVLSAFQPLVVSNTAIERFEHLLNAFLPMLVIFIGIVTLVILLQPAKAHSFMLVILEGIWISVCFCSFMYKS